MEIIIVLVVLGLAAYWVYDMSQKKKNTESDQPWPYGEKVAEGKIHVKPVEVAPGKSADDRVEATAPSVAAESVTTVVENKPAKKAPAKKQQFDKKPAVAKPPTKKGAHEGNKAPAKKAPAKKKST